MTKAEFIIKWGITDQDIKNDLDSLINQEHQSRVNAIKEEAKKVLATDNGQSAKQFLKRLILKQ